MNFKPNKRRYTEVKSPKSDILPLMDCMFILLIYFVFSMIDMSEHPGIKVDMPAAKTVQNITDPFNSIGINTKGQIFLNKREITLESLEEELEIVKLNDMSKKGKRLFVTADRKVNSHVVFKVLEKLRQLNLRSVFIETKEKAR